MFSRKITGIMIILLLAAGIAITTTRCYDNDKDARVTIHLERNDLAAMGIQPQPEKHFIDRVLEFFSTRAEASTSSPWNSIRQTSSCTVTLQVSGSSIKTYSIPYDATQYTVIIPSANNITLTIISSISNNKNWGGHTTVDLGPGDHDITIKMIPMTRIGFIEVNVSSINLGVDYFSTPPSNATSLNVYISNSINGPYSKVETVPIGNFDEWTPYTDNKSSFISGTIYYYKLSISGSDGEGVLSDAYPVLYNP